MSQYPETPPFIITQILYPEQSFVYKLIEAYSQKLQSQHPSFKKLFKQKQQRLQRHRQKLLSLNQMKEDELLRNQILEEIQIKEYEKQYQAVINHTKNQAKKINFRTTGGKSSRTFLSNTKYTSNNYNTAGKSFYEKAQTKQTQRDHSLFTRLQSGKNFRSSLIKTGSSSAIKRNIQPFQNITQQQLNRNSEDCFGKKSAIKKRPIHKGEELDSNEVRLPQVLRNQVRQQEPVNFNKSPSQKITQFQIDQNVESNILPEATKRSHTKALSNLLVQQQNFSSPTQQKKSPPKDPSDNPYHISNFIRQLNSYHYTSQYNQLKNNKKKVRVKE